MFRVTPSSVLGEPFAGNFVRFSCSRRLALERRLRQRVHAMDHAAPLDHTHPSAACTAVRARLDAYVDDELAVHDTRSVMGTALRDELRDELRGDSRSDAELGPVEIAGHLERCAPCRVLMQQLRAQKQRLRLLATRVATRPEERASEALRERVERLRAG